VLEDDIPRVVWQAIEERLKRLQVSISFCFSKGEIVGEILVMFQKNVLVQTLCFSNEERFRP